MCVLNQEEVMRAITEFNNPINLATDYLTHTQFEHINDPQVIPAMVTVINGLWGTNIQGNHPTIISGSLQANWEVIQNCLNRLHGVHTLYQGADNIEIGLILDVARQVFPFILTPPGLPQINVNYVFATKFFHWCAREYFPITDNRRSRPAINGLQTRNAVPAGDIVPLNPPAPADGLQPYFDDYRRWITFYRNLFATNANMLPKLWVHDRLTQANPRLRVENTLLRILDKYFYIQGGLAPGGAVPGGQAIQPG